VQAPVRCIHLVDQTTHVGVDARCAATETDRRTDGETTERWRTLIDVAQVDDADSGPTVGLPIAGTSYACQSCCAPSSNSCTTWRERPCAMSHDASVSSNDDDMALYDEAGAVESIRAARSFR
jgi:hypothetical protein